MKQFLIILAIAFMVGCANNRVVPLGHVDCVHKYDNELFFTVKDTSDIREVEIRNCPEIIRNPEGECPVMVKVLTSSGNELWLTEEESKNYVCRKMETR